MEKVEEELKIIKDRQMQYLNYRKLPLTVALGWGNNEPAEIPTSYPTSTELDRVNGLLGRCKIPFQIKNDTGKKQILHFVGYVVQNNTGKKEPCMHGTLLLNNNDVIASGNPDDLRNFSPIQNHTFDSEFLKTKITTNVDEINPNHGDIFVPDDMHDRFQKKDSTGND